MSPRRLTPAAAGAVLGLLLAASALRADDAPASKPVTFTEHVAPILFQHCAECHRPGQIGPMSLLSYDEVRPWVKSIKKTVSERSMPPWFADPAHGEFRDAMVMNDAEIATLVNWVDQGAAKGEGDATAPPIFRDNEWRMGTPDQIFPMVKEYNLADDTEDIYEHFVIPTGLTEDKWVVGTELIPGAADAVHHILVFIDTAGKMTQEQVQAMSEEDRKDIESGDTEKLEAKRRERHKKEAEEGGGGNPFGNGLFAKYGPGTNPEIWPDGFGRKLPAGSNIIFQVHYHKTPGAGTGRKDISRMAVKYSKVPVQHPITTAWVMDPSFTIPAGATNHESVSVFQFIDNGHIYGLTPHLHLRGKDFTYEAKYPDGTSEILLSVPKWHFAWQLSYILKEPKFIPKGTKIVATAHWDNSAANPANPNPNVDVSWGNPSTDEMMIGFVDYTYVTKKQFQGQIGLPEKMRGFNAFGGGGGEQSDEMKEKMKARREEMQKRREEREKLSAPKAESQGQ